MLDWIFEAIVDWVARISTSLMDLVSGLFLNALGTDMTVMEEYFPFVTRAFTIMQYMAWALLFIIVVWQLFKSFGGPVTDGEEPWGLVGRGALFAILIYFAKPIFLYVLDIARAPYTALMDLSLTNEEFTFAGIGEIVKNGIVQYAAGWTIVGAILQIILLIALGWNYFKLLLEVVERYVVVGILCYTSPLAYSMGASKSTSQVFKSWCRMIGSQLLLLVMNVWFLRAFNSSVGQFSATGGALSNGYGSVFLWLFCGIAFLKVAQRFDSYLASIGLNVAQTGSGLGMEILMAARVVSGVGSGFRNAGSAFRGGSGSGGGSVVGGTPTSGFAGFVNKFKGNSYVRDSVVQGGTRMGAGGFVGLVGRIYGSMAAKNGAVLTGNSISSVASRASNVSGTIAGDIADRSLSNYMPQMQGKTLSETQITGGHISTTVKGADGKSASVEMFNTCQFEKPTGPHALVTASDGTKWYQTASGAGAGEFYSIPHFTGSADEAGKIMETFPSAEAGTVLRTIGAGEIAASTPEGETIWYNSAYYDEPQAPHTVMQTADGVDWYALKPQAEIPNYESGDAATEYNRAQFENFMPGYEQPITNVDASNVNNGYFEVHHEDGSSMRFCDATQYQAPRSDYQSYEDSNGNSWYAIYGESAVERKPVYKSGEPVYDGDKLRTVNVPTVHYKNLPSAYGKPEAHEIGEQRTPNRKKT